MIVRILALILLCSCARAPHGSAARSADLTPKDQRKIERREARKVVAWIIVGGVVLYTGTLELQYGDQWR